MKTIKLLCCMLLCITLFSCDDEPIGDTGNTPQEQNPDPNNPDTSNIDLSDNFGSEIHKNFLGHVIDENHNPLQNVNISIGDHSTTTDENGIFIIKSATVHEHFAYIKASKEGYINGSRALVPSEGTNKVTIMLLSNEVTGSLQSGSASTISLNDGTSVDFEGNFQDKDGNEYTGTVDVIMHHLSPSDEDMAYQMPGMLYAGNSENEERVLQSYGMLSVELRGTGGEKLNLAEGTTADIKIPLTAAESAAAPTTIPLWHFDENKGYWIEDGEATLQGNEYVGTVSHFSFWNLDADFPTVEYCITLTDENGEPLANQLITLTHSNSNYLYPTSQGYTNEDGMVCGLIPANEALELNAYSIAYCSNITSYYTTNVGPFSNDAADTFPVTISGNSNVITETLTGTFNDCDGNPVTDGYVILKMPNTNFYTHYANVNNGSFDFTFTHCASNSFEGNLLTLEGINYNDAQTTGEITYNFTSPDTNVGELTSCSDTDEFIQYSIDNGAEELLIIADITAVFTLNNEEVNMPAISIYGNGNNCFYLEAHLNDSPYIGVYDYLDWQQSMDTGFNISECTDISNTNNTIVFNLNALGNTGEYIDINFSGDYEDYQGNPHTITGSIHVLRDE